MAAKNSLLIFKQGRSANKVYTSFTAKAHTCTNFIKLLNNIFMESTIISFYIKN